MWGQETSTRSYDHNIMNVCIYILRIIDTYSDTRHEYEQWVNDTSIQIIIWEHRMIENVRTSTHNRRIKKHKSQTMENDYLFKLFDQVCLPMRCAYRAAVVLQHHTNSAPSPLVPLLCVWAILNIRHIFNMCHDICLLKYMIILKIINAMHSID